MELFLVLLPFLVNFADASPLSGHEKSVDAVAGLNNRLAVNLHNQLATQDENLFFSPLSISTALAMIFYGARGETAEEMRRVLGFTEAGLTDSEVHSAFQSLLQTVSEQSSNEYVLHVANAILGKKDYSFNPEYKSGLQKIYNASVQDVDFVREGKKAVQEINDWVKLKTNNQIKKLLDKVDPSTVMVLLNAVYFKGTWKTQFNPEETKERYFFNKGLSSHRAKVPMMHLVAKLPYARLDGLQVLELPYKGEDISMIIVLPDSMNGLPRLEQKLQPNMLRDLRKLTTETKVHVSLPKFKLEYEKTLNSALQDLGIKKVFDNTADLRGISEAGRISLSKVLHKAVIEVNEEGSEASAITGTIIVGMIPGLPEPQFIADHPFLFAIVDTRTETLLFQGRVNEL